MKDYSKTNLSSKADWVGDTGAIQKDRSGVVADGTHIEWKGTISPDIVSKLKSGDHHAFELIFRTFYLKVKSFIKAMTRIEDLAEELAQQVFVDLWIYKERLDPDKNMSSYIYTMARNNAITALKQQVRYQVGDFDHNEEKDSLLTDDELIARETALLIDLTVADMPPKRRQVYEMSRNEDKSNDEIAEELHISKKVVEKHIRLAIKDLKKAIEIVVFFIWWSICV